MNGLAASFIDRNEYVSRLCSSPLLNLDDFGMERSTQYGLEQVYNVVDSRYRSRKPLIVTTNLTLEELQNPEDTSHARIYDRLAEMCCPVCNFRKAKAQAKMERLKMKFCDVKISLDMIQWTCHIKTLSITERSLTMSEKRKDNPETA